MVASPCGSSDDRLNIGRRALLASVAGVAGAGATTAMAGSTLAQAGVQASIMEGCISVLDFVPPAERQAIRKRKPTGDVSRHVREAIRHLTDNSILLFPPGVYPMEELIEDPVLKVPYASAYVEGLTNIAIFGYGATIQRTERVKSTGAVLVFRGCRRLGVYGLHYEAPHSRGGEDSGLLTAFLGCRGVDVHASVNGGRGIAQFSSHDLGMDPAGATSDTRVVGSAHNSHYGIVYYHPRGATHHVDIRCVRVVRSLIVNGVHRLSGRVTSEGGTSDLLFIGRHGDAIKDVNLDYLTQKPTSTAIRFSVRGEEPVTFERMRISGVVDGPVKSAISLEELGSRTLVQDLDFSDLHISASRAQGVIIAPQEKATIRNIAIGHVSAAQSAVLIDNSAGAAIADVRIVGKRLRSRSGAPALLSTGGVVRDLVAVGCDFVSDSGPTAVSISNGWRLRIDHCAGNSAFDLRGSAPASPSAQNFIGTLPCSVANELTDEMSTRFVQTILAPAGASRVAGLRDGVPGQRVAVLAVGGGLVLVSGDRLRLEGDFAMRDGDFIELICTETTREGESVFLELTRRRGKGR